MFFFLVFCVGDDPLLFFKLLGQRCSMEVVNNGKEGGNKKEKDVQPKICFEEVFPIVQRKKGCGDDGHSKGDQEGQHEVLLSRRNCQTSKDEFIQP